MAKDDAKNKTSKQQEKSKKAEKLTTFTKIIVGWLILNSTLWIWCSYFLAYIGKEAIAETLSTTVVIQVIGVTIIYAAKSLFENLSKNNKWPDKDYQFPPGVTDPMSIIGSMVNSVNAGSVNSDSVVDTIDTSQNTAVVDESITEGNEDLDEIDFSAIVGDNDFKG